MRGANVAKVRATPSATSAMAAVTSTKMSGRLIQTGSGGRAEDAHQAVAVADLDREENDEAQEDREDDRRLPEVVALRARPQEADADAEKARQQHEVGEVGEIQHVGGAPADQHELEEEHQEAEEQQPESPAAIVR